MAKRKRFFAKFRNLSVFIRSRLSWFVPILKWMTLHVIVNNIVTTIMTTIIILINVIDPHYLSNQLGPKWVVVGQIVGDWSELPFPLLFLPLARSYKDGFSIILITLVLWSGCDDFDGEEEDNFDKVRMILNNIAMILTKIGRFEFCVCVGSAMEVLSLRPRRGPTYHSRPLYTIHSHFPGIFTHFFIRHFKSKSEIKNHTFLSWNRHEIMTSLNCVLL